MLCLDPKLLCGFILVVAGTFCAGCKPSGVPPRSTAGGMAPVSSAQDFHFVEVAAESGVRFRFTNGREAKHHSILEWVGGGVAIIDYDVDGEMDLMFAGGGSFREQQILGSSCGLFRNIGRWKYDDVSIEALAVEPLHYNHACQAADYDNDGFVDVLVTGYGGLQLFHNQGDGTFRESQAEAALDDDDSWSTGSGWGDFNDDGNLDLYVVHYVDWSFANHPRCEGPEPGQLDACPPKRFKPLPDALYFSRGDGSFYDASQEAGLRNDGKGLGVVVADFDQDTHLDVYVANDTTANFLYMNRGSGRFEEVGLQSGVSGDDVGEVNGSMGVDVGDYNGDGVFDLWAANFAKEPFALYRGAAGGQFQHVSKSTGINALNGLFVGFGTAFVDLDLDGNEDIVVANGHVLEHPPTSSVEQLPLLLRNDGDTHRYGRAMFDPQTYLGQPHLGRGLAVGDLDDDGDIDMVISDLRDPVAVLRNDSPTSGSWLRVRLIGRAGNRDAIGARLTLHTTSGDQLRTISGGGSYLSRRDPRVSWGIPSGVGATGITVVWPSGVEQQVPVANLGQTITLLEPAQPANAL